MEFARVVRRRRMVRRFEDRPVPQAVLDRILETALHAPSAGFAQGLELVVLEGAESVREYARITDPWRRKPLGDNPPPVIVLPLSHKAAYLARYERPDKEGLGMHDERAWPVPYWDLDAAMAAMLMLLAAVDEGMGAWFFGIFHGEGELLTWLGVPEGLRPIGAIALGYPAADDRVSGSAATIPRRSLHDVVHRGRWGARARA
ncbi:MAG TPA: nitroreductase family protein [Actinomycetota bacterium]|nr:nitroreductase family protein [Actinomycetota bacterium]